MKSKYFIIISVALFLIVSCKKSEPTGPSIYNCKVIDEYTKSPISGCLVTLETIEWPAGITDDTLGFTDLNGSYNYNFDQTPIYLESGYYKSFYLKFVKSGYYHYMTNELIVTHETINPIIQLNKPTTHCIIAINTTGSNLWTLYFFSGYNNFTAPVSGKPLGDTTFEYSTVPSNTDFQLRWASNNNPQIYVNLHSGYNDTTYYTINY
ncbi:MAG: hypothetical protein WCH34_05815 [Bacteroidota bacterium]